MPKHLTTDDSSDFVSASAVGTQNGVAPLGEDSKVPSAYLPASSASGVTSVNGETGAVLLSASDVGAVPYSAVGNPNGVAPLDASGRMPISKIPLAAVQTVNGYSGPSVTLSASDFGAMSEVAADGRYVRQDSLVYNAKEHGAVINGTTDDAPAINSLLASAPAGATVYLPPGDVGILSPIVVPPGKTLRGPRRNLMKAGLFDPLVRIKPLAGFSGDAAVKFLDQVTGMYAAVSAEQRVENLMIFGGNAPAGVDGIQAKGNIQNVELTGVTIRDMTGNGIFTGVNAGAHPYSWRLFKVMLDNNHGHGATFSLMTDLTMIDCQAIGNWAHGFVLNNAANSQLSTCRAEWNGNHGYYITGSWGTGTGSGGMQMSGCATDRNGWHGVFVDASGNGPMVISNLMTRRDGRNGGTGNGGYAGVGAVNATVPLVISGWTNYPGTDDDGFQANSPQYGGTFTGNTSVQIDHAYLHANGAGLHNGGGNTVFRVGKNMVYATGPTATPARQAVTNLVEVDAVSGPVSDASFPQTPANGTLGVDTLNKRLYARSGGTWSYTSLDNGAGGGGSGGTIPGTFSVLEYGAIGDGVTDDLAAIDSAMTAAYTAGGGKVVFPPGKTYAVSNYMHILSNTTVIAYGATIKGIANRGLAKLYRESDTTMTGYSGHSRIRIFGGTWDVNAADGGVGTVTAIVDAFLMAHNNDVVYRDVTVKNVSGAHAIDMSGSQNVQVLNCRFEGFKDNTGDGSSSFREAIQLDFAISGSGINGAFDGTPSRNILVQGCWFGPSDRLGGFGRAVGSHSSRDASTWIENVKILGNHVEGTLQEGIRAYAWRNVVIAENTISGTGAPAIIITGPDPAAAGYNISCQNVSVDNNIVAGPSSGGSSPIRVVGYAAARPTGVTITRNTVISSPSTGIYVSQAESPEVESNRVMACTTSSIYVINCTAPLVTGNPVSGSGGASIGIDTCAGGHVTSNYVDGSGGHGILVSGGSNVSVMTNRVVGAVGSGIRATSSTVRPRIIGNTIIRNGVAATWGLDVTASATDALILNNDLTGSSWPTGTAYNLVGTRQILDWTGVVGVAAPGQNLVS
jgi:polygalacturonase